jgi:hypothetical protein
VHPSVHPRSPPPGEYACVPSFPSRQESAGNLGRLISIRFPYPLLARPVKQISCPTRKAGNSAWEYYSTPSSLI